jgi:hypothetical protein
VETACNRSHAHDFVFTQQIQIDTQIQRKANIVRRKSSRPPTWRKGAWNFLVERFLLNARFPAACYDTAEENNKKSNNKEIVRPQTSRRPFRQVGRLEAFCRTMSSGFSVASVCRPLLQLANLHSSWPGFTRQINRHADAKKSQHRSTKKFQAPYLAKGYLELFGRTVFAEPGFTQPRKIRTI